MSSYIIRSEASQAQKKLIKKFSFEVPISNEYLRGTFTIKNYRKYSFYEQVDVEFKGEINVFFQRKKDWYDSSIMKIPLKNGKVSLIKVNRFIRKKLHRSLETHLSYFSVYIRNYSDIFKLKWI